MFKTLSMSLAASAVLMTPAFAKKQDEATQNKASATDQAAAERKICKQLQSSYSRHSNKVCLTAEQWKKVEQER